MLLCNPVGNAGAYAYICFCNLFHVICFYAGAQIIKKQLQDGVDIRRVGLVAGGAPPRQHSEILNEAGEKVSSIH